MWCILTVPNPSNYLNIGLYFVGHLDNDNILKDIGRVIPLLPSVTDYLSKEFDKLGQATIPKIISELKMVVVNPPKEVNTPMEEGEVQETPSRDETPAPISTTVDGSNCTDNVDAQMNPKVIDFLLLDTRSKNDHLQDTDKHLCKGQSTELQVWPECGLHQRRMSCHSFELLFAQVRMLIELMFDIIPLSRYNHLVGNGGSKVWALHRRPYNGVRTWNAL